MKKIVLGIVIALVIGGTCFFAYNAGKRTVDPFSEKLKNYEEKVLLLEEQVKEYTIRNDSLQLDSNWLRYKNEILQEQVDNIGLEYKKLKKQYEKRIIIINNNSVDDDILLLTEYLSEK